MINSSSALSHRATRGSKALRMLAVQNPATIRGIALQRSRIHALSNRSHAEICKRQEERPVGDAFPARVATIQLDEFPFAWNAERADISARQSARPFIAGRNAVVHARVRQIA